MIDYRVYNRDVNYSLLIMENAQVLYDRILDGGKDEIDKLIADSTAEHYFLDFKRKRDSDSAQLESDDRNNLGKALSGFANSQGGILIWGVDKTDGPSGTMSYNLIKNPKLFVESLNRAISEVVTPFVDAVDSQVVFESGGEGVVATYVPESEKTPHRRIRDAKYYLRSGDSFRVMEHSQLEDMFGRRSHPKLELEVSASLAFESRPAPTFKLNISLKNIGRAVTQNYGFDLDLPTKVLPANSQKPKLVYLRQGGEIVTMKYRNSGDSTPIYPEELAVLMPNNYNLGHVQFELTRSQFDNWKGMELSYKIYSENMMPLEGIMKFGDLFKNEPYFS